MSYLPMSAQQEHDQDLEDQIRSEENLERIAKRNSSKGKLDLSEDDVDDDADK